MKLSVIVPVYKVVDTLDRCIQSIVSQNYPSLEIIIVDDGSPDSCPQLCDAWAKRDNRIHIIHKENGGLSDARNAGIDIATGDYVTFVDSDDYIAPDTYSNVMELFEQNISTSGVSFDLIEYSADIFVGSEKEQPLNLNDAVYTDMDEYWLKGKAYAHSYAWNKIYRRELFSATRFPKGKVFEDVYTLPVILSHCHCVATTSRGRYYYCHNPKGITSTADGRALADLLEAHTMTEITDQDYYRHVLNIQIDVYRMTGAPIRLNKISRLNYSGLDYKARIKAFLYNTIGLDNMCRVFKLFS